MTNRISHSRHGFNISSAVLFAFICLGIIFYPISEKKQSFLEFQKTKDIVLVHLEETINLHNLLSCLINFFKQEDIEYQPIRPVQQPSLSDTYRVDKSAIDLIPKTDSPSQDISDLSSFIGIKSIEKSIKE